MSLFELRQRRLPAWLGILAVVMIFLAPPISQSLRNRHHVQTPSPTSLSAMAPMSGHHEHHGMDTPPAYPAHSPITPMSHGEMGMEDHAACGYCVLLSHLPLLALSGTLQPAHAVWLSRWQKPCPLRSSPYLLRFLPPLARAPPLSIARL
ncbi:DUF2946 domain-containing protein [Dickeya zeae]|uniref:DUF2946 domain-containing protein n=1 Tax=Dickeya zeae TaxID=204042 RepID=UPI002048E4C0|nr:DUF2946 domain-containing protein [Dickeya zeae]